MKNEKGIAPLGERAKIKTAGDGNERSRTRDCQRPTTALLEDRYPTLCRKIIGVANARRDSRRTVATIPTRRKRVVTGLRHARRPPTQARATKHRPVHRRRP